MKIIKEIAKLRAIIKKTKSGGKTIGLVPTMGYLHEGHLSLVRHAKKDTGFVVVSIFVNPAQFNNKNDLAKYPSDLKRDVRLLENAGADLLFLPSAKEIYKDGHSTYVNVEGLTKHLCGAFRPGHFRGVTTVVAKLFNIITPDAAYFGLKDAQQAFVIQRMAKDLDMDIRIKLMPTVREQSGLALSSRNARLSPTEKRDASVIYRALQDARDMVKSGVKDRREIVSHIKKVIRAKKSLRIEYADIVDTERLMPLKKIEGEALIAVAAWAGRTRLIDNVVVPCRGGFALRC